MVRATPILLRKGRQALQDLNLLKVLQSEIAHELSTPRFQDSQNVSAGDFVVDWDSPKCEDLVLRRKYETGEEVAVSALLGRETLCNERSMFPREVLMKICVKKPGFNSIVQFDCQAFEGSVNKLEFNICNAYYIQSPTSMSPSAYKTPLYSSLEPKLQEAFKEYLNSKGIGESLSTFLLHHLHKKEQGQYVNWLHKLESIITDES